MTTHTITVPDWATTVDWSNDDVAPYAVYRRNLDSTVTVVNEPDGEHELVFDMNGSTDRPEVVILSCDALHLDIEGLENARIFAQGILAAIEEAEYVLDHPHIPTRASEAGAK